ncbi:YdeI/OmpD-associated family protein [Sulfitobacter sp. D35]|uniref:YdeI/OmpD-associated family protein n=1 Tax=Sulfitobacter sp. D35 TaxID=3083252 RepID=UPI00296F92BC|nr:YdeI/OmpD-associated family protein [Sulfitobacter sp. D35]MDW4497152.1 YdeI/OmpD-associated family protein [Sulfitobacter sp. D35]
MRTLEIIASEQLWSWLAENHRTRESVRLVTWKAAHRDKFVGREDVLDALIAHGWIDGRRFVVDDDRTAQLISPRKQQAWSKTYKERAERLRREGRMHEAGEAAIEQGRASGLWDFYDDVDALIVPDDLASAVELEKWEALAPSYRRNVLRWIKLAKTPATRSKRIDTVAAATREQRKLPQM